MINVLFRKDFEKQLKRLPKKKQDAFFLALDRFFTAPYNLLLHNHSLNGKWKGYRSIDVDGDLRAVYKEFSDNIVRFASIGTHHQLFGS